MSPKQAVLQAVATMFGVSMLVAFGWSGRVDAQRGRFDDLAVHVEADPGVREVCGTRPDRFDRASARPLETLVDGQPLMFEQNPSLLTADYDGPITFRNLRVVGNVPSLRFHLGDGSMETWDRTGTDVIGGRMVSIFKPSWSAEAFARVLRNEGWGWDAPQLYWGEVLPNEVEPGNGYVIQLRIGSPSLPRVPVTTLAPDVQYSSHIVNIRLSDFGNGRFFGDDHAFEFDSVTRKFYQYFEDTYDAIAVVPDEIHLGSYTAFHRTVQSDVRGIGKDLFDDSVWYGSLSHRLHAVELFTQAYYGTNRTSPHEAAHQWGSFIDWTQLTGLERAGWQPASHDPLWAGSETRMGAVLEATRRVRENGGKWQIEATPAPMFFHPLMLYGMGVIPKEQVPEFILFDTQGQFGVSRSPAVGTAVTGAARSATIYNIVGMLGERSGPVRSEWHRATIIVSRDRLLTQREMDYWTFLAMRVEDPNHSGLVNYSGYGSFDIATHWAMDLKQDIRPKGAAPAARVPQNDFPDFGVSDLRGIRFDSPIATHYSARQRVRWSGRVTAGDRSDFNQITLRLWRSGGTIDNAVRVMAPVSSAGTFIAEVELGPQTRGRYELEVFLFWPGSGSQVPRAILTPFTIE